MSFKAQSTFHEMEPGVFTGTYDATWGQGRSVFGGLVTATAARAMRAHVASERELLSVDTSFYGPVATETATRIDVRVMRAGKHMTSLESVVTQAGAPLVRVAAVFGTPRESRAHVEAPRRALEPRTSEPVPYMPGITPAFIQHMSLAWSVGGLPFSGATEAVLGGWCRHGTEADGDPATLGLLDAWPAPLLPLLDAPAMASTVRWTANLVAPPPAHGAWCFFECRAVAAAHGYGTIIGHLYDAEGALVGWGEQLVAVFDKP